MTGGSRFVVPDRWLPGLFAAVTTVVVAAGALTYRQQVAEVRATREAELAAIGALKASRLLAWRTQHLADARMHATAPTRIDTLDQWLRRPGDVALRARLTESIEHVRASHDYRAVWLATADGAPLLAAGAPAAVTGAPPASLVEGAAAARAAVLGEFQREPGTGAILIDVAAPIVDRAGRLLAVLALRDAPEEDLDPAQFFPLLQSWPTPSRTAETLLVRRDGERVRYMSRLRHAADPPLALTRPLSATDLVAVQAVHGATGIVRGRDYRGAQVLADVRPVAGSDWLLISKVDEDEIYANARWRGYTIGGATIGGVVLTGLLWVALGGRRRRRELLALMRAERARREALEEARATLRSIGDAVISTDVQGRVRQMNPVAERLTGWRESEAAGRPLGEVLRIVDERTRAAIDCPVARVLQADGVVELAPHALLAARDGSERPIADSGAPLRDEDGAAIGVVIAFRDQSAERAAQARLAASEARLRLVFDTEPECVKLVCPEGRLLDINAAGLRLMEVESREQVLGRGVEGLIHPDDRAAYADLHRRALAGDTGSLTFRVVGLKSTERWLESFAAPFRETGDAISAVLSVTRDVTELRHRQQVAAFEAGVLEAISAALPLTAVLRKVCLGVEAMLSGALTSVLLVDPASGRLVHGAAPSLPADYQRAVDGVRPGPNVGSCGTAVHRREAVIVEDIATDPLWQGHAEAALAHGLRACWSVPVLDSRDEAIATFAIYYREPKRPAAPQIELIGRIARMVGIAVARHRHDEALRESEARFRQIAENIRDVFWIADAATGRAFYVSPAYESIWGRKANALRASADEWLASLHPDDRERMRLAAQRLAVGEYDETYRIVRPDGEVRWIHDRGYPVRNERGEVYRVVGVATDITLRRAAEAQLHKLSRAIEQSSENIVITDTCNHIVYVNEAFAQNTGYTREELLGRNPHVLQSGKTPRATYASLWAALKRGEVWRGEFINRRKDGSEYIEEALISPIRSPDGTVTHYLATKQDVTARRQAEQELEQYRRHLEELVASRTQELEAARAQAEAANRAKSAFLASMSHEIRTPMNGVLGMLEVLERSRLSEQQLEMVRTARDSGRTLLTIIDDILDFSKIEAGRMHVERTPVAVAEVVETLAESLVPLALRREVDLSVYVDPGLPAQVATDALRLRQILFNLAGNAIKFSAGRADRRGRVRLRVTVASRAPFALALAVVDNGIGMSEETVARLFTPFTQAEASTTRRFGGTGLGLTICKRLADLMGGRIEVQSRLGEGSTFTLTLPCEVLDAAPAPAPFDLAGVHCLLLEAPEVDTEALVAYLTHAGAQVHAVTSAEQAASRAAQLPAPVVAIRHAGQAQPTRVHAPRAAPHLRHVLLAHGRRRRARLHADGAVMLDVAALRQAALLHAVAVAAGRALPQAPREDALPPAPPPSPEVARARGELILVAEDDEVNRMVIRHQLEALGYVAEYAVDGAEALRLVQRGGYTLLLTDVNMPGLDGYALTRAIRAHEAQRGLPRLRIVALTANAMRGEAEQALAAGMDDYLTKPLRIEVLQDAFQRWLAQPPTAGAADAVAPEPTFDAGALARTVGADAAAMRELLAQWRALAAAQLAEMRAAAPRGDQALVGTLAHRLKSSSRAIGAIALGGLCEQLENAARTADNAAICALLARAADEHAAVEAALAAPDRCAAAATGAI